VVVDASVPYERRNVNNIYIYISICLFHYDVWIVKHYQVDIHCTCTKGLDDLPKSLYE
jgi:hypothetical protein